MRRIRPLLAVAASLSAFAAIPLVPGLAHAADPDSQRARALFDEAGDLERQGQWGAAEGRLRAALRLRDTPQLHYALAWALENEDKLIEARLEYELAARGGREKPGSDEVSRLATARLIDLEKKIPVIRVHLSGAERASARVVVDGREVRVDDDTALAAVNPGSHVVRVERGSDRMTEEVVYVGRSSERTVETDVGEAVSERTGVPGRHMRPTAPAMTVSPPVSRERSSGALPWALLATGLGLLGGSVTLLVAADSDADDQRSLQDRWCTATACAAGAPTRPETAEAAALRRRADETGDRETTKETLGYALGGAGLVSATIGAILLLRGERHAERTSFRAGTQLVRGGAIAGATISF